MRLRPIPAAEPPVGLDPSSHRAGWIEETYKVTVVTPIFGGGVGKQAHDLELPVRPTEIRGQLRFWWRLLQQHGPRRLSGESLFESESEIFGKAAEGDGDASSRIAVAIRLANQPAAVACQRIRDKKDRQERNGRRTEARILKNGKPVLEAVWNSPFDKPGISYALFGAQSEFDRDRITVTKEPAKLVTAGLEFLLQLGFRSLSREQIEQLHQALRWWASFGGIGARTRRGLGSVWVRKLEGEAETDLVAISPDEAASHGCTLATRPLQAQSNAIEAWSEAIQPLFEFRQGGTIGRNGRHGPSRWPEANAIRAITGQHLVRRDPGREKNRAPPASTKWLFPRAYFGLPVVFHFKDGREKGRPGGVAGGNRFEPSDSTLVPLRKKEGEDKAKGEGRMASPLILKAMRAGASYQPIALCLPTDHLDNLKLALCYDEYDPAQRADKPKAKTLLRTDPEPWWPTDSARQASPADGIFPLKGAKDAIEAFLEFFSPARSREPLKDIRKDRPE